MTTLAHRLELRGPRNGGVAARRAVVRWAWRLFRREWRRQILVTALLTVAVAAAIGSVTIAYNSGAADDAEFGSADHVLRLDGADPRKLQAALDSAKGWFGTTDVIGHRTLSVPGGFETVEFRAQDPRGAYGDALLALRQGSYPVGPSQAAVTDGVARLLDLEIGETLALDGQRRTVVGIVENPRDLGDEFALLSPSSAAALWTAGPPSWGPRLGPATRRQARWRCSPWPPSSCSWLRWLPPQASLSSRNDGSASLACSLRSA